MKDIVPIEPTNDLDELMKRYRSAGFGARRLAESIDVLEQAIQSKTFLSLGLAGAMVPAGMKSCINEFIRNGWVNATYWLSASR
jgi:deoxyhypusine synthase